MDLKNTKVMAYRRENGRVGVRNHVIILPLDDLSNAACLAVEWKLAFAKSANSSPYVAS